MVCLSTAYRVSPSLIVWQNGKINSGELVPTTPQGESPLGKHAPWPYTLAIEVTQIRALKQGRGPETSFQKNNQLINSF